MKKALTPSSARAVLLVLAAITIFASIGATSASAVNVTLRIETPSGTLYHGPINATPLQTNETADGDTCLPDATPKHNFTTATPVTAVAAWANANGVDYNTTYGGTFLCRVGAIVGNANAFWLVKVNNLTQDPPGNYVTGGTTLKEGDEVLWFYTDDFGKPTLSVKLPSAVQVGTTATGTVYAYDTNTDARTTVAGAAVKSDTTSTTSGADGGFSLTFPSVGTQIVTVNKGGTIRGSAFVNVTATPVPALPTSFEKRVAARAKCRKVYKRQKGPRFKTCMKQANAIGKKKPAKKK